MADNKLPFKISSGLKNIIGRDLITDDYVAVFELVKNSFDAYAKKAVITFEGDKIVIADDGKGMNIDDIMKKWLFVAYSAKKEGVEDAELEDEKFKSYRDKIQAKKFFAGAKGIGRFSCDRLGNKLMLTTKKASSDSLVEQIEVNWKDFDLDPEEEFININVTHRTLNRLPREFKDFKHGTVLEITGLNNPSSWNRKKKIELRHSLEKLINPFEATKNTGFSISIRDESELQNDKKEKEKRYRVNGKVNNFVIETLGLKTTQIILEIDAEGKYLTIELIDRGTTIYKIRKDNPTEPKLHNITFHLFHLNRIAKSNFTRLMGIQPVNFGSVFLYKNGVRIAPYGDVGIDFFGLDVRKAQAHYRRLGTRDMIGRIEISGDNPEFIEISSRDGGLVRNDHYKAMIFCFINHCLFKLEKYLREVQWKFKEDKNKEDLSALNNITAKSATLELIKNEIKEDTATLIDIDQKNLNLQAEELLLGTTLGDIESLKIIAGKLGDKKFTRSVSIIEKAFQKNAELQEKLKKEKRKNLFLLAAAKDATPEVLGLVHHIEMQTNDIYELIDMTIKSINKGKFDFKSTLILLTEIKLHSDKILKISRLITHSNFNTQYDEQEGNLVSYITEYCEFYKSLAKELNILERKLKIDVIGFELNYDFKFSAIEMSIILDNLFSNAHKHKATKCKLNLKVNQNTLTMIFGDNGSGVNSDIKTDIFDLGFTTTKGSGIGLYYVKELMEKNNGAIKFIGNNKFMIGANFELKFQK